MMMQMLEAGGLEVMRDAMRTADESNPQGYYELDKVKELDKGGDPSWLKDARGKAVKIIAFLLKHLPENLNYRIIFMNRNPHEMIASQNKMLALRGESSETDDERMLLLFEEHVANVKRLMANRVCFDVIDVEYEEVLNSPSDQAIRISRFLGKKLDPARMAAIVKPELYRSRR